jgi:hypothetical protein
VGSCEGRGQGPSFRRGRRGVNRIRWLISEGGAAASLLRLQMTQTTIFPLARCAFPIPGAKALAFRRLTLSRRFDHYLEAVSGRKDNET